MEATTLRLRDPAPTQKTRPCEHSYHGGDVPGNPIDAHLLQMISPELKLAVSASQGLASHCKATRQQRSLRGQERHCIGLSPIRSVRARRSIILSVGLILSKK